MTDKVTKYWLVMQYGDNGSPKALEAQSLMRATAEAERYQTPSSGWAAIYDAPDHREHRPARATRTVHGDDFDTWVYAD